MNKNTFSSQIDVLPCEHYFAAANTYKGFKSYFDEVFSPQKLDTIYILKGGPGVGKSTLMKKCAELALEKGLTPVCYHCSSDPYSLDGVVIREKNLAIIDGTAPHATDPSVAGVKEIIINMGQCWDIAKLRENSPQVLALSAKKSSCYKAAYKFLDAEKQIKDCLCEISYLCLLEQKMQNDIQRRCKRMFKKLDTFSLPTTDIRITNANSCMGDVRLFTFEKKAKNICFIKGLRFIEELYTKALLEESKKYNANAVISKNPCETDVVDGIYFPQTDTCFTAFDDAYARSLDKKGIPYTVINMRRFCDNEKYSQNRAYYRFGEKCRDEMHTEALSYLADAGKIHAHLEKIYSGCTDYKAVSAMSDRVIDTIFKSI